MDKGELTLIISEHYEKIIEQLSKEAERSAEDYDSETIARAKHDFESELDRIKKKNYENLELKYEDINLFIKSINCEKGDDKIREKLFEGAFCFHIRNELIPMRYMTSLGVLVSVPIFFNDEQINSIEYVLKIH